MPLLPGKKNIGKNIETEQEAGKPRKQAIAIALDTARKSGADVAEKKKKYDRWDELAKEGE
jgi:hypothetical protein